MAKPCWCWGHRVSARPIWRSRPAAPRREPRRLRSRRTPSACRGPARGAARLLRQAQAADHRTPPSLRQTRGGRFARRGPPLWTPWTTRSVGRVRSRISCGIASFSVSITSSCAVSGQDCRRSKCSARSGGLARSSLRRDSADLVLKAGRRPLQLAYI